MALENHGRALEYDLITKTNYTLDDIGGSLSWRAMLAFVENLDHTSAFWREINPDMDEYLPWLDGRQLAFELADMIDLVAGLGIQLLAKGTGKRPKRQKPYERPGMTDQQRGIQRIGKDPIPISEFDSWWESRSRER